MNLSFGQRDRRNQEMASSLTASLLLLSLVFMQFVSAADQNNVTIKAEPGDNPILPCKDPDQGEITVAEWSRTDLGEELVLLYRDGQIKQHPSYKNRVDLLVGQIKKGDASLILQNATTDDSRTYQCRVVKKNLEEKLISTVNLQVSPPPPPEPFPVWAKVLLVLLVLLVLALVAAAGVSFYFCLRWKPVPEQVEVESGVESVLLPFNVPHRLWFCKYRLSVDKVEWRDRDNRKVHVNQIGSDQPGEQHQLYRTRTKMDDNLLKTGDFSLTLSWPTEGDGDSYTCRVYSRKGDVLMKKQVQLQVKVQQKEVESGVKSVLLPCRTTESLDGDVRVEWRDGDNWMVHVYQNGSDQSVEQHPSYKGRTKMDENPLKNKNLSLTLMDPTFSDLFTCSVSRDETVLMMKRVQLEVKAHQVEVEQGAESVTLEFKVTFDLQGEDRVEWWDKKERIVHVYQNGSDQPVEQAQVYRTRTEMNKDALETKDLSLTLRRPTEKDSKRFRCGVYRNGELLRIKTFYLNIKAGTVQDQPEDIRKPLLADQSV